MAASYAGLGVGKWVVTGEVDSRLRGNGEGKGGAVLRVICGVVGKGGQV